MKTKYCKQCGVEVSRYRQLCDSCRQSNKVQRWHAYDLLRRKTTTKTKTKDMTERTCARCQVTKPAADFRLKTRRNDRGYQVTYLDNVCKRCNYVPRAQITAVCSRCGTTFAPHNNHRNTKFCSRQCRYPIRHCKQCGAETGKWARLCTNCRDERDRQRAEAARQYQRQLRADPALAEAKREYGRKRMRQLRADPEFLAKDKDRLREYRREPAIRRNKEQKRIARANGLPRTFTLADWQAVLAHFDNRCAYCGQETSLHQDHFIPLSKGGPYTRDNIVPACPQCNGSKHDQLPLDWLVKQDGGLVRYAEIVNYLGI